jgi:dihydroxy-acid dehydratase
MITTAIIEDDAETRRMFAGWLRRAEGFDCVAEYADAEAALLTLPDLQPQVILSDINLPGINGTECVRQLKPLLNLDALTITGKTLGQDIDDAPPGWDQKVVRRFDDPVYRDGAMVVLRGNLAPSGAIIKQCAAAQSLLQHEGRAVVFSSLADLAERIDDPDLDVNEDDILVLQNSGPKGVPGMPESGYLPIPKKLAQRGVKDMVRVSDARMSGTAFGTIVLHVSPESAVGGPLALVKSGDRIRLDTAGRRIDLLVSDEELAARRAAWVAPAVKPEDLRGYRKLYMEDVEQAERGVDFAFMRAPTRGVVPRS